MRREDNAFFRMLRASLGARAPVRSFACVDGSEWERERKGDVCGRCTWHIIRTEAPTLVLCVNPPLSRFAVC